uniref:Uncharacterized protein n=1 Tax=viral metagenome TaxID=1070528 RepID=A0A6C0EJM6_9ZZZZ
MDIYIKYLNKTQIDSIQNYKNITDLDNVNPGDSIKYIYKKNLKFRTGGVVVKKINNTLILRNMPYKYSYPIDLNRAILFHKVKKIDKHLEFMKYLSQSIDNNTLKITKVE